MSDDQFCPICGMAVTPMPRYPNYVCATCTAKTVSLDGRPLRFFNLSMSGGFGAEYADTGEPYDSSICYIGGMKCFAVEAHFGGIVIQVVP